MKLDDILAFSVKSGASDIHLKAGLPPVFRINGELKPLSKAPKLMPEDTHKMAFAIMNDRQKEKFNRIHEADFSYGIPKVGRFRVNAFSQRGSVSMVFRVIPFDIKDIDDLYLPPVVKKIAEEQRGLVLVTGATGSGKSTTLAAMIGYINKTSANHIVTVEDPIEYLHRDQKSVINQREVGLDTDSFANALKSALRQDPDIILVGEMRDEETIETALHAAETGHLVFSTLHTIDATETVNRIVSVFPPHQQQQIRTQMAGVIKGVISQRLVPRADGKGRVPAVEIMVSTARTRDLIRDELNTKQLPSAIQAGYTTYGMQTFDQSLMGLLSKGLITYDEALLQSTNPDDFKLKVSGVSSGDSEEFKAFQEGEEGEGEEDGIERF